MQFKKILFPLICAACLATSGLIVSPTFAQETALDTELLDTEKNPAMTEEHYDSNKGLAMIPPANWKEADLPGEKYIMAFKDKPVDGFAVNLNVSNNKGQVKINDIGKALKKVFSDQFEQWELRDEGYLNLKDTKAYFISSKFFMSGYHIQNLQVIFNHPKRNQFHIVTFTSREDNYKDNKEQFIKAIQSIVLY